MRGLSFRSHVVWIVVPGLSVWHGMGGYLDFLAPLGACRWLLSAEEADNRLEAALEIDLDGAEAEFMLSQDCL